MTDTLLLIASNDMLSSDNFPQYYKSLEDLSKDEKDCSAWKKLYKADDRNAKVKKQAVAGQGQFGVADGTLRQAPQVQQATILTSLEPDL